MLTGNSEWSDGKDLSQSKREAIGKAWEIVNSKEQEAWSSMLESIEDLGDGTTVLKEARHYSGSKPLFLLYFLHAKTAGSIMEIEVSDTNAVVERHDLSEGFRWSPQTISIFFHAKIAHCIMEEYGGEEDPPEAEMHYGKKLRNEIKYTGEYIGEKRNSQTLFSSLWIIRLMTEITFTVRFVILHR